MPSISKTFAKLIVKKFKLKDWDNTLQSEKRYDSALVYYENIDDLITALTKMKGTTPGAKGVRIYFGRYPPDIHNAEAILRKKDNFHKKHVPTDDDILKAKEEYQKLKTGNGKLTLLFIGVDATHKEILIDSLQGETLLGFSTGFDEAEEFIENHGELSPPPRDIEEESLYQAVLYP